MGIEWVKILVVIASGFSFLLGFLISLYIRIPNIGVLRIIRTNEEKDIYRFEFNEIDKLDEKKYAVMLIKTEDGK